MKKKYYQIKKYNPTLKGNWFDIITCDISILQFLYAPPIINFLKEYKYKVAFCQHSGVINETSNLYYLPRFSLNQRYGEIDRVKFAANAKGLGIYDFIPTDPSIKDNPPFIGFS